MKLSCGTETYEEWIAPTKLISQRWIDELQARGWRAYYSARWNGIDPSDSEHGITHVVLVWADRNTNGGLN